jgi:UDP-3-O-[3-hydroxymyristoyl] glucosamine N-acyltransferase
MISNLALPNLSRAQQSLVERAADGRANCLAGQADCLITAGFFIAGSSSIGDNCVTGGNVAIADHVNVTSKVQLGGRSTVTKDITEPGIYTGYPIEPLKDGLRTLASLPHLTGLRKQVAEIRKKLNLED